MRFQAPANPAVLRGTVIYSLSVAVLLKIRSQGNSATTAFGRFLPDAKGKKARLMAGFVIGFSYSA